jgi:hypothetical protein
MNLRELVIHEYQSTVRNHPNIPRELKDALKVNERLPAFMDNLCRELSHPAFKNHSNNQLREVISETTNFFISLVKKKAEEQMMSEIAKMTIKQEIKDKEIINRAVDTGIIDEETIHVLKKQAET